MLPEINSSAAVLLFHSHRCPHCVEFRPRLQALRRRMPGVEVWELDVDADPAGGDAAKRFAVGALPTAIFLAHRIPVGRSEGSVDDEDFLSRARSAFWWLSDVIR